MVAAAGDSDEGPVPITTETPKPVAAPAAGVPSGQGVQVGGNET